MAIEAQAMKEIPLSLGKVALVDDADFEKLSKHKWCAARDRNTFYVPQGKFTDHVNGDGLDNRRANLRAATISQNGANRKIGSNNTSGVKGVTWHKRFKLWQVSIGVHGRPIHLGRFRDLKSAECIYKLAAFKFFGGFAGEPQ